MLDKLIRDELSSREMRYVEAWPCMYSGTEKRHEKSKHVAYIRHIAVGVVPTMASVAVIGVAAVSFTVVSDGLHQMSRG